MVVVADASVAIRGDMSGFHNDLRGAEKATGGLASRIKDIFSPRNVVAGAGLFGVGLGIRQLIGYAGDAADAFSELQQTQRTTDEVFGDSASVIEDWAKRSADAAGMSQRTVFQSASVMGQTLVNMGFSAEDAADKVVLLQQRAAEMAVAFGSTPERAILAITAAMRGERDTIEKFGVSIKQVDVNSRVAALGLDTSTAAAKKNAEAMAILDLVIEQTGAQAGRFADGADDRAIKMMKAQAKFDDFMTTEVGAMVASIQLGAFEVGDAIGGFFDTASGNVSDFSLFFGSQRNRIMEVADSIGMSFEDLRDRVARLMGDGMSFEVALEMAADPDAARAAAAEAMGNMYQGIISGSIPIEAELVRIGALPAAEMRKQLADIQAAGYESQVALAAGIMEAQNAPQLAIDAALKLVEDELTTNEEIMHLKGQLQTLEVAKGMAEEEGQRAAVIAIDSAMQQAIDRIDFLQSDFHQAGYDIGVAWANGLRSASDYARLMAWELAASTNPSLHGLSPPKEGPLKDIDIGGRNVGLAWAEGVASAVPGARAASHLLAGAFAPSLGAGSAAGMARGGGDTYLQLVVDGTPKSMRNANEMWSGFDQLGRFGEPGR